jgi:hypothetical protein
VGVGSILGSRPLLEGDRRWGWLTLRCPVISYSYTNLHHTFSLILMLWADPGVIHKQDQLVCITPDDQKCKPTLSFPSGNGGAWAASKAEAECLSH